MENLETRIKPDKISFRKNFIMIKELKTGKYRILYKDIVLAKIRVKGDEEGSYQEPEITDITGNMEGDLILYDRQHTRWVIQPDRTGKKAGELLKELCIHAPYIMVGNQDWFDCSEEADFEMVGQMVSLMRECGRE